jgi:hypothetical protein
MVEIDGDRISVKNGENVLEQTASTGMVRRQVLNGAPGAADKPVRNILTQLNNS